MNVSTLSAEYFVRFLPHILPLAPHQETHLLLSTRQQASSLASSSGPAPTVSPISPYSPLRRLLEQTTHHLSSPTFSNAFASGLNTAFASLSASLLEQGFLGGIAPTVGSRAAENIFTPIVMSASEVLGGGSVGVDPFKPDAPMSGVVGEVKEGKRLAESLVGVKRWGTQCFAIAGFGMGNEIVDVRQFCFCRVPLVSCS